MAARLFIKISRVFHIDLPLAALFEAPTIEQLADLLRNRKAEHKTLIPIQPFGTQSPFFCVHGGAGATLFLYPLASHLGNERPFYGIEPEGMDGKRVNFTKIEDMAAHYISEIKRMQPAGPYYIGGYCFGGLVAFEMARQLVNAGEDVALTALFNAPLRFNRPVSASTATLFLKTVSRSWHAKLRFEKSIIYPFRALKQALWWRTVKRARMFRVNCELQASRLFVALGLLVPPALRRTYVMTILGSAERAYTPQTYSKSISLFRGKGLYDEDPELGWSGLAHLKNFEIGEKRHRTRRDMMSEPTVRMLARQLKICLERAAESQHALDVTLTDEDRNLASSTGMTVASA